MAKSVYGGYQGTFAPILQGGLGIAGGTAGRVSSPSSFIAPTQQAYDNVYKAAANTAKKSGALLNVQGMVTQPGEVSGQFYGLLPDARQYWIDKYNKGVARKGQKFFESGRFKGMGAPTFASGDEFADWMTTQVMNQPKLKV